MPDNDSQTVNISIVNANTLDALNNPDSEYSLLLVNRTTNKGVLLDYSTLVNILLNKLYSDKMPDDGMKFYVVE